MLPARRVLFGVTPRSVERVADLQGSCATVVAAGAIAEDAPYSYRFSVPPGAERDRAFGVATFSKGRAAAAMESGASATSAGSRGR